MERSVTTCLGRLALAWLVTRWQRRRARREHEADFLALALITPLYAKHGTDEQLDRIYDKWHTGVW